MSVSGVYDGRGGVLELATSMQLLRYDKALMTIIVIFVMVLLVEQISAVIRKALMKQAISLI